MKVSRTYPQPDSPALNIGPHERAMAVYKYFFDEEPETAVKNKGFPLLVAAFEQAERRAVLRWEELCARGGDPIPAAMQPSTVEMLAGWRNV